MPSKSKTATAKPASRNPGDVEHVKPSKTPVLHPAGELTTYARPGGTKKLPTKDKKLRANIAKIDHRYRAATSAAKDAELLRPESGPGFIEAEEGTLERTWKVTQGEVRQGVDVSTASKGFALELGFGPYVADYTRDGRSLLLAGRKGHVAGFQWREGKLACELQLGETVRDAKWLHSDQYFAVAQKKYVYIYDSQGTELHCLQPHIEVQHMQFLPYHFLLATIGSAGYLKYHDTSTGNLVTELRTGLGTPTAMTQNRRNAILHIGHHNGTVTLWTPNLSKPAVTILAHKGPVRAVAVDRGGYYMASAGSDGRMNIFDIRNTFKEVHSYFTPTPATCVSISDTGLLGVGWGGHTTVWKDSLRTKATSPYMTHHEPGRTINHLTFCPFEDILGTSHNAGFTSLIVPGSGEANFDALEANPYATKKERQHQEVRQLLEKLRPEMISLDPDFVGTVAKKKQGQTEEDRDKKVNEAAEKDERFRMRGKNSAIRRLLRKKAGRNVRDERREKLERLKKQRADKNKGVVKEDLGAALERFVKKKN
ncbi:small nucleolar ribonucleo protein complex subunit [Ascodesmis nigricans]|uniref:U three protein 7 n=1 Tax=Ascodesmis nigricans TaxID=341454 RepID=A0A4S2N590_9PEZI|nr:small nucleolar ribonucleo protein complex subunit [Ascodesmis nigricans]